MATTVDGKRNHSVGNTAPLQLPYADLVMAPYLLGAWLSDRHPAGVRFSYGLLRALGVLACRHIPPAYLRSSEAQRRALLAGLLDPAGTVTASGKVRLTVASRRLAERRAGTHREPRLPVHDDDRAGPKGGVGYRVTLQRQLTTCSGTTARACSTRNGAGACPESGPIGDPLWTYDRCRVSRCGA